MKFPSHSYKVKLANDPVNIFFTIIRKDGKLHYIHWHSTD